jgi:hypothetical protein
LKLALLDERVAEQYLEHRGEKQCLQPGDPGLSHLADNGTCEVIGPAGAFAFT